MNELTCPYCQKDVRPSDDLREQEEDYEHECEHCGKTFVYYIRYSPSYHASQADCLNGAAHDYQPIIGYPEEFFTGKLRCTQCGGVIYKNEFTRATTPISADAGQPEA